MLGHDPLRQREAGIELVTQVLVLERRIEPDALNGVNAPVALHGEGMQVGAVGEGEMRSAGTVQGGIGDGRMVGPGRYHGVFEEP